MNIQRIIQNILTESLSRSRKIILIFGARQTGKTTLCNQILETIEGKVLKINGDEIKYTELISSRDFAKMKLLLNGYDVLFIDEAQ